MIEACKQCANNFSIEKEDTDLLAQLSVTFAGHVFDIPLPSLCPSCRFQRRAAQRNERNLYSTKCDATGKSIISIYKPEQTLKVYNQSLWWSDKWEPKSFGRDFDFSRTFFEQWQELRAAVPRLPLLSKNSENSDYTNHAGNNKNCYLSFILFNCEDVFYSRQIFSSKSIFDSAYIFGQSELLYECFWGESLYDCKYCIFCSTCSELNFCYDCRGCSNCFMSSNLRNKQYVFCNQQLTKVEYQKQISEIKLSNNQILSGWINEFSKLIKSSIKTALRLQDCEDVSGDFLLNCKNTKECYFAAVGENCMYCIEFVPSSGRNRGSTNCMDCFGFGSSELLYEVHAQANGYNNRFCYLCYDVSNSLYCDICFNTRNCFGCVGLHAQEQYCILNKQYSKLDYEETVTKIIGHMIKTKEWGEFFPISSSLFGYNESVAQEYFPLSKSEALEKSFNWSDYHQPLKDLTKTIEASELPDNIEEVSDQILTYAIRCEQSGKLFRILKQELDFYRKQKLPIPMRNPEQRFLDRIIYRNPPKLEKFNCPSCKLEKDTSFSLAKRENVLCEDCYLKEVH